MKKSNLFTFAALSLFVLALASCSKYPEGSKFTILTKKMRLVNTWKLDKFTATSGGFSVESSPDNTLEINKDNTFKWTYTSGSGSYTEEGTWGFSSNKEDLILTYSDNSTEDFDIIKLKNKELSFEDADGSTTYRYDWVQK